MPSTLQTPKGTRCIRCATLIRNSRKNCPSCDLDFAVSNSAPPSNGHSKSNSKVISRVGSRVGSAINPAADSSARNKNRAARAGMRLCPVCMMSVAETEMSESGGQMVCNTCASKLKNKPARAPGAPGAVASNSAPPQMVSKSEPEPRHVPTPGGKPIMGDDELLTAKGMQRQLMGKLVWIKVLVVIWGLANLILGVLAFSDASSDRSGHTHAAVSAAELDGPLSPEDLIDDEGNKISEEQARAERRREHKEAQGTRSEVNRSKLAGVLAILIGLCFLASFFTINKNPYEVCAIITGLYIVSQLACIALIGAEYFDLRQIFVIASTLSTLVTGIRTGMRIKDIRERAEAATGRPVIA